MRPGATHRGNMTFKYLTVEKNHYVATVTFNRPQKLNA